MLRSEEHLEQVRRAVSRLQTWLDGQPHVPYPPSLATEGLFPIMYECGLIEPGDTTRDILDNAEVILRRGLRSVYDVQAFGTMWLTQFLQEWLLTSYPTFDTPSQTCHCGTHFDEFPLGSVKCPTCGKPHTQICRQCGDHRFVDRENEYGRIVRIPCRSHSEPRPWLPYDDRVIGFR